MTQFDYVRQALEEESKAQKKSCTKKKLGYKPKFDAGVFINTTNNVIALQFWGWELVLSKDGTYYIDDTSGG